MSAPGPSRRSSEHDDWQTPQYIVDAIATEICRVPRFMVDPCAGTNSVISRNGRELRGPCTISTGYCKCGLCSTWHAPAFPHEYDDWAFWNPPYSEALTWVEKAVSEYMDGIRSVGLLPNSTDTYWWHKAAANATQVIHVEGRIGFYLPAAESKKSGNTGGSTLFVYDFSQMVRGHGLWRRPDRPKDWMPPVLKAELVGA